MANVIDFPMHVHRLRSECPAETLRDFHDGLTVNGYALAAFQQEFEVACRRAIGRLGEAGAMSVLKDVIISIQGDVS